MMNQMHHGFIKTNNFSTQLISLVQAFTVQYYNIYYASKPKTNKNIYCEIIKTIEKEWQSATYEGNSYNIVIRLSSMDAPLQFADHSLFVQKLNDMIAEYEFSLKCSFVAEISADQLIHIADNIYDITCEALIIYEE